MLRFIDLEGPELPQLQTAPQPNAPSVAQEPPQPALQDPAIQPAKAEQAPLQGLHIGEQLAAQATQQDGYEDVAGLDLWGIVKRSLNALDAVRKAGANPLGLSQGKPNDVKLVANHYRANPQAANQYDMATNFFLRYMSGIGTKGLEIGRQDGQRIYGMIRDAHLPISGGKASMKPDASDPLSQLYVAYADKNDGGGLDRLGKGHVPVRYNFKRDGKTYDHFTGSDPLAHSLGQFWAVPQKDGSYIVEDRYDFFGAPGNKGGDAAYNKKLKAALAAEGEGFTLDPKKAATRIAAHGNGKPFSIRFRVYPDGRVQVLSANKK